VLRVYSDLRTTSTMTPLAVADILETKTFPALLNQYPNIAIKFGGEIKDTRESGGGMVMATILVIGLILGILMLLFNGLSRPLVIMIAIPFGTMGIILTFLLHGIHLIGLFTAIGALGLAGVVVNDSIVLVDKLDNDYDKMKGNIIERAPASSRPASGPFSSPRSPRWPESCPPPTGSAVTTRCWPR
jgi:multidrug efflux pump subunit AcrB